MAGVRIVTDSASDLPQQQAEDLGIEVVPLTIRFGDEEYVDRDELDAEHFYRKMAESGILPETAAPAPGAFELAYKRQAEAGASAIVCINLSEKLSATIQAARAAAEGLAELHIEVVDSRSVTSGLGSQVLGAARAAADGASADEVVGLVEDMATRTRVYGTLDTLENLKKGGRIGGAQALAATVLSIKPCIDLSSGVVEEAGRVRTRRKALAWLCDQVVAAGEVEALTIRHGMATDVGLVVERLEPHYGDLDVGLIGPVIGSHTGPRVVGVTFQVPAGQ